MNGKDQIKWMETEWYLLLATWDRKNSLSSLRNSIFRGSGHPFIGLETLIAQSGRPSFIDVPGIFLPEGGTNKRTLENIKNLPKIY